MRLEPPIQQASLAAASMLSTAGANSALHYNMAMQHAVICCFEQSDKPASQELRQLVIIEPTCRLVEVETGQCIVSACHSDQC